MRILMVAPQPFLESRGTPLSILGRLKALSELGHDVDLLTYSVGQNVSIPKVVIHRTPHIRFIRTVKVGPSVTKLFLDILLFIKAFRLLQKGRYDLLHSHEEASFFGILLARLFKVRHLYDMHSSLPQQLGNFQYTNSRVLIRLFKWLEYQAIHASDAVITVCPALEEQVRKVNGYIPHVMIENVASGGDPGAVSEEEVEKFQVAHSLAGKRIILYAGTFEPYQGLDLLVASAEQVIHRYKDVVFLLIGGNPSQVHSYQTRVKELSLSPYFRLIGMRPPEEIPPAIRLAHILVSPRINGTNTPLKIYGYLQSGKPIVATNIYTHTQVLSTDVAVLVEPNPEALARGILTVLENPCLAAKLGAQARQMFEDHYGFPTFLQKTAQALQMALR